MSEFDLVKVTEFKVTPGSSSVSTVVVVLGGSRPIALSIDASVLAQAASSLMGALAAVDPARSAAIVARDRDRASSAIAPPPAPAVPVAPFPSQPSPASGLDAQMIGRAKQFQDQCRASGLSEPVTAALIQAALTLAAAGAAHPGPDSPPPYRMKLSIPELGDREIVVAIDPDEKVVLVAPGDGFAIKDGFVLRGQDAVSLGTAIRSAGELASGVQ